VPYLKMKVTRKSERQHGRAATVILSQMVRAD
jgi:hypothetical protein